MRNYKVIVMADGQSCQYNLKKISDQSKSMVVFILCHLLPVSSLPVPGLLAQLQSEGVVFGPGKSLMMDFNGLPEYIELV